MDQKKRFRVFLFGSLIGIICVYFVFSGGNTSPWTPNDRTLLRLRSTMYLDDKSECLMECHQFNREDLKRLLMEGDVVFGESDVKNENKTYVVKSTNSLNETIRFSFSCIGEKSLIIAATFPGRECDCEHKTSTIAEVFPNEAVLLRLRETWYPNEKSKCLMECHTFTDNELRNLLLKGKVDFAKSDTTSANKTYFVTGENKAKEMVTFTFVSKADSALIVDAAYEQRVCDCE